MKCVEQHFPTYKIISEEIENDTLTNDITFIIDPLDGTNDFVNKT
jgi:fructose-1,6-bisphosphatase/inositol monophosphatase family enzyme